MLKKVKVEIVKNVAILLVIKGCELCILTDKLKIKINAGEIRYNIHTIIRCKIREGDAFR